MTSAATSDLTAKARAGVEAVPDPELPPVTLGMLGMVKSVEVVDAAAAVVLLPTWSGCPAQEMMGRDVVAALLAIDGIDDVRVEWSFDPVWSPGRINAEGRERLRSFGIAPPTGVVAGATPTAGQRVLPLAATVVDARPCPWCGSDDTVLDSAFGPTPCRDLRLCRACRQPFEAFKQH